MKRIIYRVLLLSCCIFAFGYVSAVKRVQRQKYAEKDTTQRIFIYSPGENEGLHLAYFLSDGHGKEIGQLCSSDYSSWGSEKKMYYPYVEQACDGTFRAVWQVNDHAPCFAAAYSDDLLTWRPQDFPRMSVKECLKPVIYRHTGNCKNEKAGFDIVFYTKDGIARCTTASFDFRHFSSDVRVMDNRKCKTKDTLEIGTKKQIGYTFSIPKNKLDNILKYFASLKENAIRCNETMVEDSVKLLPDLQTVTIDGKKSVKATLTIDQTKQKKISEHLIGVFFEDLSYAADGGLYAEMIQNRDFEYTPNDHRGWSATTAWHCSSPIDIEENEPLSKNNPHYVVVGKDTLCNEGWDGIAIKAAEKYDFSFYVRNIDKNKKSFTIALTDSNGKILSESKIKTSGKQWNKYSSTLTASATNDKAKLMIVSSNNAKAAVDMVSLFPQNTFHGRKNGLRKDLADTIAALHPKFVRFPGGCMSHGDGIDNIYHWNNTIGELYDRKPDRNIWNYHQTRGLGFYEYFQFCEDIGAEPLPVLAAGVPCQNSVADESGYGGQQGGINMSEMPIYCQEILDMIDWANGDPHTSKWAKMRAEAGHPAPFNLKYIGIGNEDIISTVFEERFLMIAKAVKEKYPDITLCGTVGPFHYPSSDYIEGWKFAKDNKKYVDMVDEHYYESTGWFMNNQSYYDNYDRNAPKVYIGEYAANTYPKASNVEVALAEAMHLCNVERNADVVYMTSYAPLLSKDKHQNWHPDMIYFNNTSIRTSPSYETQRLFSVSSGDKYISSSLSADSIVKHRVAASVVEDSKSGNVYIKIVNAMPVQLSLNVDGMELANNIKYEGFEGSPKDLKEKRIIGIYTFNNNDWVIAIPAYSVRIINIKNK
ncbi:alpha-L-arabinofuranosidase C-terminal domain-containing protein [Xylanibacter oryzae]|uniref:alpha-L-arabinofuranosidase C-terminal domain-containing protein n=1 Tax=Xylanibacter oryzae TaxID=185293 RepID=UPI0004AFAB08|nr:alpha-L-arabinofuranosidase C-terminal domain-containing protein [Xylanibacter oryzae]